MSISLESAIVAPKLGYDISDADQHFHEAPDSVTKYLESTYRDVMPLYEDSLVELSRHFPVERIIYGSDWPHPEGLADPQDYISDLSDFGPAEQRMIMRENLRTCAFG